MRLVSSVQFLRFQIELPAADFGHGSRRVQELTHVRQGFVLGFADLDVQMDAEHAQGAAFLVPLQHSTPGEQPDPAAIFVAHADFAFIAAGFSLQMFLQGLGHIMLIACVYELPECIEGYRFELLFCITQ